MLEEKGKDIVWNAMLLICDIGEYCIQWHYYSNKNQIVEVMHMFILKEENYKNNHVINVEV